MNEEKTVMSGDKPRKKKRSLWWLWFLLILAAFAGGCVAGLKINTLPLPTEIRDRLYPVLESYIPGSTTPRTPDTVTLTSAPTAAPEITPAPAPETPVPESANASTETGVSNVEETPAPEETSTPIPTETEEPVRVSDTAVFESSEPSKRYIGVGAALEIALKHAGIEEGDAEISGVYRTKDDDGEPVYEVGFAFGDISYDYVIGALDGEIAGWKMSGLSFSDTMTYAADFSGNDVSESELSASSASDALIGEETAKEIAYNHAAVKPAEVLRANVELNADVYIVEFKTASRRFNYEINAYTGEILADEVTKSVQ